MRLDRKMAIRLLEELGYEDVDNMDNDTLTKKLRKMPERMKEAKEEDLPDNEEILSVMKDIIHDVDKGKGVTVVDADKEEETEKEAAKAEEAPKKKKKHKEAAALKKKEKEKTGKADKGSNGKAASKDHPRFHRVGIVQTIIAELEKASKEKPASVDKILGVLEKKFPDRDAAAMKKTVNGQVYYNLEKQKGRKPGKSDKGFWLAPLKTKKVKEEK